VIKAILFLLKRAFSKREELDICLSPSDPRVQKLIEMVRLFELEQYEVLNPVLHHYAFRFSDGSVRGPVGIVEIASYISLLQEHGLYRKTIKRESPADIVVIAQHHVESDRGTPLETQLSQEATILPFKQK